MSELPFTKNHISEVRDATAYISQLPPLEIWIESRTRMDPSFAVIFNDYWKWLARSLDAFFQDLPDPLPLSRLPKNVQQDISEHVNQYLYLSILLFQAEKFLRKEALAQRKEFPFQRRSELLKFWAFEECLFSIRVSQGNFITLSEAKFQERQRDIEKYLLPNGKYQQQFEAWEQGQGTQPAQIKRWDTEDKAMLQWDELSDALDWTKFCCGVFKKYKSNLPAYEPWIRSCKSNKTLGQWGIINGHFVRYPGRGKGRKNNRSP